MSEWIKQMTITAELVNSGDAEGAIRFMTSQSTKPQPGDVINVIVKLPLSDLNAVDPAKWRELAENLGAGEYVIPNEFHWRATWPVETPAFRPYRVNVSGPLAQQPPKSVDSDA